MQSTNATDKKGTASTSKPDAVDHTDLTMFQVNVLAAIAAESEHSPPHGLGIKDRLEEQYSQEINHGRLYPNLDTLVDEGLVDKGEKDQRTNSYTLTDAGARVLKDYALKIAESLATVDKHAALARFPRGDRDA